MLAVLQGLKRRGLRVFSVEPNIWWLNNGRDFVEYAYIQARSLLRPYTVSYLVDVGRACTRPYSMTGAQVQVCLTWLVRPKTFCASGSPVSTAGQVVNLRRVNTIRSLAYPIPGPLTSDAV